MPRQSGKSSIGSWGLDPLVHCSWQRVASLSRKGGEGTGYSSFLSHLINLTDMEKTRNSNLELYRILVMLSIVAHHYVVNSGLTDVLEQDPTSARSIYYYLFGAWGKVGINCFVLITGYFMCKSQITAEKFMKLLLEVMFYKVMIHGIFMVSGIEPVTVKNLFYMFMPITSVKTDFTACFLLFFLCIPFLNILVRNMTQRQHQLLLALLLVIYTILGTLLGSKLSTNYVTWFCVLYFISSYIRLYNPLPRMRWGLVTGGGFCYPSLVCLSYFSRVRRWVRHCRSTISSTTPTRYLPSPWA